MNLWNQEQTIEAWNFASRCHANQLVPGTSISYINHIGLVTMEIMAAIAKDSSIASPTLAVLAALLHDTIEDTETTPEELEKRFGTGVANGVLALSKDKKLPSKAEQMDDSLNRIQKQPTEIWMVKMADRITNLQPPPKHWNHQKIKDYKNESQIILERLGKANGYLAERLSKKIEEYDN